MTKKTFAMFHLLAEMKGYLGQCVSMDDRPSIAASKEYAARIEEVLAMPDEEQVDSSPRLGHGRTARPS